MQLRSRTFQDGAIVPFQRASVERIRRKLQTVKVQQARQASHMAIGMQQPKSFAPTIREFLLATPVH
jgi:hypothetical protein